MNINSKNTILVFVYGSLKNGFRNNRLLSDSVFLAATKTKSSEYVMMSFGGFPGVYKTDDNRGKNILGEVYEVDRWTLQRLDTLESNGHFYTRELVEVEGIDVPVWMYMIPTSRGRRDNVKRGVIVNESENTFLWARTEYDFRCEDDSDDDDN